MTSKERKENRFRRRYEKRNKKIIDTSNKYADLNSSFVFHKVMYYSNKCQNNVRWKTSTINYMLHEFTIISNTCYNIKNNSYKVNKTNKFIIKERGKIRNISAPNIKDRLIHKVLANEVLIHIYNKHLIYDCCASLKNKGFKFTIKRVKKKLANNIKKYGTYSTIILIDYSKYFENCNHSIIHNNHLKYIKNDYTIKVIEDYLFIDKGLSLGIEIAQIEANLIPSIIDHYFHNKYPLIRYMDDTIIFTNNKNINILDEYINYANKFNIIINKNKTKVVINDNFKYCKWKYIIDKHIIIPDKSTIYRQRRKLRKIKNYKDFDNIKNSFIAYLKIGNSYNYIRYLNFI